MFKIRHENFVYNNHILFLNKAGVTLFEFDLINSYKVVDFQKWHDGDAVDTLNGVLKKIDGNLNIDIILDDELSNLEDRRSDTRGGWSIETKNGITYIEIRSIFDDKTHLLKIENIVIDEVKSVFARIEHSLDRLILSAPNNDFRYNVYFKFNKTDKSNTINSIPNVSFAVNFPRFVFGEYLKKSRPLIRLNENKNIEIAKNSKLKSEIFESGEEYFVLLDEGVETSGLALFEIYKRNLNNRRILELGVFREQYPSSFKKILPQIVTKDVNPKIKDDWQSIMNKLIKENERNEILTIFGDEIMSLDPCDIFENIKNKDNSANITFFSANKLGILKNKEIIEAARKKDLNVFVCAFNTHDEELNIGDQTNKIKVVFYANINSFQRREITKDPSKDNLINLIRPI